MKNKTLMIVIVVTFFLALSGCSSSKESESKNIASTSVSVSSNTSATSTVAKKEESISINDKHKKIVEQFMQNNLSMFMRDQSSLIIEEFIPDKDWANGKRYNLFLKDNTAGNPWSIYFKDDEIVGVYYCPEGQPKETLFQKNNNNC